MKIYGKNVFNELKNNKEKIKKVYISEIFKDKDIMNFIKENKIPYVSMDKRKFSQIYKENTQGIVIDVSEYEYKHLNDIDTSAKKIVILDHLEDPHNFGAIIRTCEANGIKNIIIPKDRSVKINATVIKTSSGAIEYVDIVEATNLKQAIDYLKKQGYFIYGAEADGINYDEVNYANKVVLVIGSEGNGLTKIVRDNCDEIISIPMNGKVNSLNASVSAGVLIYGIKNWIWTKRL